MNIEDRPTPETDKVVETVKDTFGCDLKMVHAHHARNLERQKDALREALENLLEFPNCEVARGEASAILAATKPKQ
jgi:hypothetical protein